MNAQLEILAALATTYIEPVPGHSGEGWVFDKEKFAELIVRECIVDFYRRYLDITSNEDITVQVERYIEQNFGVEG